MRGQEIGKHGTVFIEEIEPVEYTNPNGKQISIRQAQFICSACSKEFTSRICNIQSNAIMSCGCLHKEASQKSIAIARESNKLWLKRGQSTKSQPNPLGCNIQPPKNSYTSGEEIGSYGLIYLCDVSRDDRKANRRSALFVCGHCQSEFITTIKSATAGNTRSCGCLKTAVINNNFRRADGIERYVYAHKDAYQVICRTGDYNTKGDRTYIGRFSTKEEAIIARDNFMKK